MGDLRFIDHDNGHPAVAGPQICHMHRAYPPAHADDPMSAGSRARGRLSSAHRLAPAPAAPPAPDCGPAAAAAIADRDRLRPNDEPHRWRRCCRHSPMPLNQPSCEVRDGSPPAVVRRPAPGLGKAATRAPGNTTVTSQPPGAPATDREIHAVPPGRPMKVKLWQSGVPKTHFHTPPPRMPGRFSADEHHKIRIKSANSTRWPGGHAMACGLARVGGPPFGGGVGPLVPAHGVRPRLLPPGLVSPCADTGSPPGVRTVP